MAHAVHNQTIEKAENILTDNCNEEDGDEWIVPEATNNTEAEIIINMGCMKRPKGLQMKNIKKAEGGTKHFTILLSDSPSGPWKPVLKDKFSEHEGTGCEPMQSFDLK